MATIDNCLFEPSRYLWSVSIFAARESPDELIDTIKSIVEASAEATIVDVMVNGNSELASETAKQVDLLQQSLGSSIIRVWSISLAGKAHAWNQYVHNIWPGSTLAYFVDGYARVQKSGLQLLAASISSSTDALAAGGVPVSGGTARQLREHTLKVGGLHGALFVLKEAVMLEMRDKGFRLPLGLYGFDSLLGAVLAFGLDPSVNNWDIKKFVILNPDVVFIIDEKKWWRYSVIKTQFKRILNNALRVLVVEATKYYLARQKRQPECLPKTVEEFVLGWVNNCPGDARKILRKYPICRIVLKRLKEPRDWSAASKLPELIYTSKKCCTSVS